MSTPTPAQPRRILDVSAPAYHPMDRGNSHGSRHLVVSEDYAAGRFRREAGDALCKPRAKFWQLDCHGDRADASCKKCAEIARRHGLGVRSVEDPR